MASYLNFVKSNMSALPRISPTNLLEIAIISFLVYQLLLWIKNSRAYTLLKGLIVIFIFTILATLLHLDSILWILEKFSTIAVIVLVIIFQPELRKALEQLGSQKFLVALGLDRTNGEGSMYKEMVTQISKAVFSMSKVKTGALICIEQSESLSDFVKTGILINGQISSGLLINIFEKNTPLHDGAVIIRGNLVVAATCYLPLTDNPNISKDLGTRHRAAIGMSEATDCIIIIVSEETGSVSIAYRGKLTHVTDESALDKILINQINKQDASWISKLRKERTRNGNK